VQPRYPRLTITSQGINAAATRIQLSLWRKKGHMTKGWRRVPIWEYCNRSGPLHLHFSKTQVWLCDGLVLGVARLQIACLSPNAPKPTDLFLAFSLVDQFCGHAKNSTNKKVADSTIDPTSTTFAPLRLRLTASDLKPASGFTSSEPVIPNVSTIATQIINSENEQSVVLTIAKNLHASKPRLINSTVCMFSRGTKFRILKGRYNGRRNKAEIIVFLKGM